jgi:hypothetical protein
MRKWVLVAAFLSLQTYALAQPTNAPSGVPSGAPKKVETPEVENPPYPGDSQITFEWNYSCPSGQPCSFTCPGGTGGSKVTKLAIYLGSIPIGGNQRAAAIFYNFSTQYFPNNNGFTLSTGIGVLGCQVNGMRLNYSGPPKM